jgi:hypothetical protein
MGLRGTVLRRVQLPARAVIVRSSAAICSWAERECQLVDAAGELERKLVTVVYARAGVECSIVRRSSLGALMVFLQSNYLIVGDGSFGSEFRNSYERRFNPHAI